MNIFNSLMELALGLTPKPFRLPITFFIQKRMGKLEKEIFFLDQLIDRPGKAIDIGANKGIYTYFLSKICTSVEAFEPQEKCTNELRSYSKFFRKRVNIHNCGLSSEKRLLKLEIPVIRGRFKTTLATGNASFNSQECEHYSVNTPVNRLDDYNFKDVVFIKIDVEGHEKEVIEGAIETICREKPVLLIEIEQRHLKDEPIDRVFQMIQSLGYKGFFVYQDKMYPLAEFSYQKYQAPFLNNLKHEALEGNYINNFIFKPSVP